MNVSYTQCDECGEWYRTDEMYRTQDGHICEDCYADCGYMYCDECGCCYPEEKMERVRLRDSPDDYFYVCVDCLNSGEFVRCDCCGEYVQRRWAQEDNYGNAICDYCYARYNYYTCDRCGRIVDECDIYYCKRTNGFYCEDCNDDDTDTYIHSYHDGAHSGLKFHETDAEPTYNGHVRYFGIELEVDDGNRSAAVEDVFYTLNGSHAPQDDCYAHFEEDGSLNNDGFEIITQPMSRGYLETFRPRIEEAVKILSRAKFRSHDAQMCGLHIHVSRDTLTPETINNMIYAISLFWYTCVRISRRTPQQLARYARSYAYKNENEPNDTPDKVIARVKDAMNANRYDRYFALNTTNSDTVELRICRGTLNVDTIYASLDFFAALIKFAETYSETDMIKMSVDNFNAYLKNYSNRLAAYMEKRGL